MAQSVILTWTILASLVLASQPAAPEPVAAPLRDLQFGDINFLHTTDTHGWHAGHLLEPSYGADWGDYIDFSDRLREKVEAAGQDFLVVDTGDRVEGNGLYDGDQPRGRHTFEIFTQQHIDLICSGNHELYKQTSSEDELYITVPAYHEAYVASNLDILNKDGEWVPLAQRFRKFTTKVQGLKIVAFGFIFNFERNDKNTRVIKVEDAIEQEWFKEAIRDHDVDLFVVIGHAGIHSDEFRNVYKAIRSANWDTPIQFFGGHVHVRDAAKFDSNAYGLASGRFMETIGFQSISGISKSSNENHVTSSPKFFRRYIDNNLYSYYHHTGLDASTFHSQKGRNVSSMIDGARKELKLDSVFGCAPQTYWMQRAPYPAPDSVFTLLNETVMPEIVEQADRADKSRLILVNTGAIRFDIFKGPFTKDSTFIVSPFTSKMQYIKDVPLDVAVRLLSMINGGKKPTAFGMHGQRRFTDSDIGTRLLGPPEQYSKYFVDAGSQTNEGMIWRPRLNSNNNENTQRVLYENSDEPEEPVLTPGYVTFDQLGTDGDDTLHSQIPFYLVPNVIQSLVIKSSQQQSLSRRHHHHNSLDTTNDTNTGTDTDTNTNTDNQTEPNTKIPETVDLIFNQFLQPDILSNLQVLKKDYTDVDVSSYMHGESMTSMLSRWIAKNWAVYCEKDDNDDNHSSLNNAQHHGKGSGDVDIESESESDQVNGIGIGGDGDGGIDGGDVDLEL